MIVPKFRRVVIYNKIRRNIIEIIKTLVDRKPGLSIVEDEACADHIHLLLEIPPKYSVSEIMRYLKSKSTLMIFDRHANLKYKYGNRYFWARGYFVDTVGKYLLIKKDSKMARIETLKMALPPTLPPILPPNL